MAQFSVRDKVCVVTGATGVLGGAMALGLAKAGARVVILGRREAVCQERAAEMNKGQSSKRALGVPADVTDRASLERAREKIWMRA